jgi:hypothetical protein
MIQCQQKFGAYVGAKAAPRMTMSRKIGLRKNEDFFVFFTGVGAIVENVQLFGVCFLVGS